MTWQDKGCIPLRGFTVIVDLRKEIREGIMVIVGYVSKEKWEGRTDFYTSAYYLEWSIRLCR